MPHVGDPTALPRNRRAIDEVLAPTGTAKRCRSLRAIDFAAKGRAAQPAARLAIVVRCCNASTISIARYRDRRSSEPMYTRALAGSACKVRLLVVEKGATYQANKGDLMRANSLNALIVMAALTAMTSASVNAADLRRPAPVAPVPVVYAHNWTGFYIGGHVGGAWSDRCLTVTTFVGEACNDASGWLGGGQIGFNLQTGQF